MSQDRKGAYKIGYGKPPRHTQFIPGQSGNPKGRPKGSKNLATVLGKTLSERIHVSENGQRRSISKLEAAVKQLVNKAASGDPRFMQQLLTQVQLAENRAEAANSGEPGSPQMPEALILIPHNGRDQIDWEGQSDNLEQIVKLQKAAAEAQAKASAETPTPPQSGSNPKRRHRERL